MEFYIKPGYLIVGNGHDLTSKIQHICNGKALDGSYATHGCTITWPTGWVDKYPLVLSAEYNGVVHEFWDRFINNDTKYDIWVYEIVGLPQYSLIKALDYCEKEFLNDKYAYLSWPWFAYAAIIRRLINPTLRFLHIKPINIDKEHNWYFKDCFCTAHCWHYIYKAIECFLHDYTKPEFQDAMAELVQYYPDTFQPVQYKNLLLNHPKCFKLKWQRVDGVISFGNLNND
jgi:hypothetical protein